MTDSGNGCAGCAAPGFLQEVPTEPGDEALGGEHSNPALGGAEYDQNRYVGIGRWSLATGSQG
jgi:hypothetical protein